MSRNRRLAGTGAQRERTAKLGYTLFTQKTKGHVMLPIPAELRAALDALPFPMREDGSQMDSGYFFWSGSGKKSSARGIAERMLAPVFRDAKIAGAHAHRFRHTLATDILAKGGTMADVADVLGISEHIARWHYAKWSAARQERIATIMRQVHAGEALVAGTPQGGETPVVIQ